MDKRVSNVVAYVLAISSIILGFNSCVSNTAHNDILSKCDSLQIALDNEKLAVLQLNTVIASLNDSISKLSFPADQRLNHILNLIKIDSLDSATSEIDNLVKIFPHSKEAQSIHIQTTAIENRRIAIKKEQERIKALGFKVLKDQSVIWEKESDGDEIKYTFSNFHFGKQFTFNYINDIEEYYYRTADKGNTYILADVSMYTKADYAYHSSVYVCKIVDGKLSRISSFSFEYETYDTYGAYLGNYADTMHDFSKVNTIRYNIGAEISQEESRLPLVLVMIKDKNLNSVDGLTVSEVLEKCEVVRVLNRNKL